MPVRARSASSIAAMCSRPERLISRSASRSASTPSRIMPPSRASAGGSSTSADASASRTSARSSSSPTRLWTSGAAIGSSTSRTRGIAASDWRSATRSRGPAVPSATRPTRRSRSWTARSVSRSRPRSVALKANSSTASSRSWMRSSAVSGRISQARSRRAPITVCVRSSTDSSEPSRPPSAPSRISRWRNVIGSISRPSCRSRQPMARTCARSTFCVSRRYSTSAPAAHVAAGWPSSPKACRPLVRSWSHSVCVARSTPNAHSSSGVTAMPRRAISGSSAAASTPCATITSRGRSTPSSSFSAWRPSAPAYSAARNSPVETSSSATPRPIAGPVPAWGQRQQEGRLARVEVAGVGQRAGRDDARDVALDDALGLLRVLDLIADGDAEAALDEPRDVAVGGVERDAAHRHRVAGGVLRSRGQRQLEGARGRQRVLVEHLEEVAHPEEQDGVAVARLGVEVLPHRGGDGRGRRGRHRHGKGYNLTQCCSSPSIRPPPRAAWRSGATA